ncbi:MAG: hypothetical protein J4432_02200 [DPANN group archaeon]|nr:hypothetical protein [DPANN group archaeon]
MAAKKAPKARFDTMKVGHYSFVAGIAIAVTAGIINQFLGAGQVSLVTLALVLLGVIVGFLNIQTKEREPFLIAAIALGTGSIATYALDPLNLISIGIGSIGIGALFIGMVGNISIFVAPAAIIVAIKTIWDLGSTR